MAIQTTFRRGNTLQHSTFTGALAELTVDTDKKVVVVHDGSTVGGIPLVGPSTLTTANVSEVTNQYFTNARARAAISVTGAGTYDNTTGVITVTGGVTSVGGATGAVSNVQLANAIITSGLLTTSNVAEGSNLYFTTTRVWANVSFIISHIHEQANVAFDQANLAFGSANVSFAQANVSFAQANVAFNQANIAFAQANVSFATANLNFTSANTYVNARLLTKANVSDLTTANVSELNNLYFTNTRVNSALTMQTLGNATFSGTVVANVLTASNIVITPEVRSAGGTTHIYTSDIGIVSIDVNGGQTKFYNSGIEVPGDVYGGTYGGNRLSLTGNYASLQGLRNNRVQIQTGDVGNVNNTWTFSGVDGSLTVPGNIVPSSNLVHNLGSPTNRWKDLFLSGNTIDLGGTTISSSAGGGLSFESANIAGTLDASIVKANVWQGLYTSNVVEVSSNLYFTNTRARAAISNSTGVSYNTSTGVISIGQDVGTSANVTFGTVNITGNLNVYGNAVLFQSNTLIINDPLLQVGKGNPADALDLGFVGHYNDGVERHAGFFRDASDSGKFKVFDNLPGEPDAVTVNTANASFRLGTLVANVFEGNLSWNNITNRPTTDGINEGSSNLYFTTARVYSNVLSLGLATNAQVTVSFDQANTAFAQANVSFATSNANFSSANTYVNTRLLTKANVADLTTANVSEVTNLYYTNTRVQQFLSSGTAGNVIPSDDITYNLGSPSKRWKDLYLSGNTINLGNATISAVGTGIALPPSSTIDGLALSSFSGAYNDLTNKPANVINFSNVNVLYSTTYTILQIDKTKFRSGTFVYNIEDDANNFYATLTQSFIHKNNVLSYSNTVALIGTAGVHEPFITLDEGATGNISLVTSFNNYAVNYFGENYSGNATVNVKGSVSLIEV